MKKAQALLTEADWRRVFKLRCETKQGHAITDDDLRLVERAHRENPERYRATEGDVFNATVPFGSSTTWKENR